MMKRKCNHFTSTQCVDGSCPIALKEQYPEAGLDAPKDCNECPYRTGKCRDCIFKKTMYCDK